MITETAIDLEGRTLKLTRDFNAPVKEVFEAWVEPENLIQWWGPEGVHIAEHSLDVREGGAWRTVMENKEGTQFIVSGVYKTIKPVSRLVFTWAWQQDDGSRGFETEVDVSFETIPTGTRLRIVHSVFETAEAAENHASGWTSSLVCLEKLVASK